MKSLYQKTKENLKRVALVGLASSIIGLSGCGERPIPPTDMEIGDYIVNISDDGKMKHLYISPKDEHGFIHARGKSQDGFNQFNLHYIFREGNSLDSYANLDSLNVMWDRAVQLRQKESTLK